MRSEGHVVMSEKIMIFFSEEVAAQDLARYVQIPALLRDARTPEKVTGSIVLTGGRYVSPWRGNAARSNLRR